MEWTALCALVCQGSVVAGVSMTLMSARATRVRMGPTAPTVSTPTPAPVNLVSVASTARITPPTAQRGTESSSHTVFSLVAIQKDGEKYPFCKKPYLFRVS